jgi:hypothetical protein
MSARTEKSPASPKSWLVPAVAAGVLVAAVFSYGRTEERQAAAGSPYYDKAVKEAINGLLNAGAAPAGAEGTPPLPAGLDPAQHYWCANCKAWHKRDAAGAVPAGNDASAAIPQLPGGSGEIIPPLPANLSAADYYWCPNCKAYHPRDKTAAAAPPAAWPGVPFPLPAIQTDHP